MSNQIGSLKMGQKLKKTPAGEIPVDWGVATISDLCQVNPEVIKESTPPDAQLKYIDIASIERTGSISIPKDMKFKDAPSRARRIVKAGDIIVSTVRPYLKAFARITDLSENIVASTGFAVLRARPNVNGGYVYQHVLSDTFVKYLEEKMTGSSYPAVNSSDVAEYQMPVPTAQEQENIGRILSDVDILIDNVDAEIEKTKELKKSLMCQLLTHGIGHKKFKKTKIGKIPVDWRESRLGELVYVRYGLGQPPVADPNGVLMIRATNIKGNKIVENDILRVNRETLPLNRKPFLEEGDIIVVRSGVNTGDVALVTKIWAGAVAGYDLVISPSSRISPAYCVEYLLSENAQAYFSSQSARSAQPHLNAQQVSFMPIPLPSLPEQKKIAAISQEVDKVIDREEKGLEKVVELKKSLMSMLLTGKVRVN
ncbi:MAG: restriction endonuclease subunit S [Elusimicrobiota bacterium]